MVTTVETFGPGRLVRVARGGLCTGAMGRCRKKASYVRIVEDGAREYLMAVCGNHDLHAGIAALRRAFGLSYDVAVALNTAISAGDAE